mgnify:CR=1 FL=1
MKTISVSKFKAHLSAELSKVRKGQTLVITDHDFPVAQVSPYEPENQLSIVRATRKPGTVRMDHGIHIDVDAVALLLEDRQR